MSESNNKNKISNLLLLPSHRFTPHNSSRVYGAYVLDVQNGRLVGKSGWKIIGYGKAPYPNDGNTLALMLEKTEQPDEGECIWHHCADWMFEDTFGKPNFP